MKTKFISIMCIFSIATGVITLLSNCDKDKEYTVGDIGPSGGYVFYDKGKESDGWRYLEAAPTDQSNEMRWGCPGDSIAGSHGSAIGTGKQNTKDIIQYCAETDNAAHLCNNLTIAGNSGWFLPSKEELNLMYLNLKAKGLGAFEETYYWSSTEATNMYVWAQDFYNGSRKYYGLTKNTLYNVRAVRTF